MAVVTIEQLTAERDALEAQAQDVRAEAGGERFTDEQKERWNQINAEIDEKDEHIRELEAVERRVEELAQRKENTERGDDPGNGRIGKRSRIPENVFDLAEYRRATDEPEAERRLMREGAKKALESAVFADERADEAKTKARLERLLDHEDDKANMAYRMLATGSPTYQRAFWKLQTGKYLNADEQRAMQFAERTLQIYGDPDEGSLAVPFTLDPTFVNVSDGAVNPIRAIASQVTITNNEWRGITHEGVVATYEAELTPAVDGSPTLAQPSGKVQKAQAFVPFSIEAGQDIGGLQQELARAFAEAKDNLEAEKFLLGQGDSQNEPQGIIDALGPGQTIVSGSADTFTETGLARLRAALPPRFRARASWLGNIAIYDFVRFMDDSGGSKFWVDLGDDNPPRLMGKNAYEASFMAGTYEDGDLYLLYGDFNYYKVVDRVGLNVELIQHLMDPTTGYPIGARGMYAYWRNTGVVLSANAFRVLTSGVDAS